MKVKYKDPYELPQEIIIPDGNPEALKEIMDFLNENARFIQSAERRERYHTEFHLDALEFENSTIADRNSPERNVIRKEDAARIDAAVDRLSDTQRRRLLMRAAGMTLREIAAAEGTSVNAVKECLDGARRKILEKL